MDPNFFVKFDLSKKKRCIGWIWFQDKRWKKQFLWWRHVFQATLLKIKRRQSLRRNRCFQLSCSNIVAFYKCYFACWCNCHIPAHTSASPFARRCENIKRMYSSHMRGRELNNKSKKWRKWKQKMFSSFSANGNFHTKQISKMLHRIFARVWTKYQFLKA